MSHCKGSDVTGIRALVQAKGPEARSSMAKILSPANFQTFESALPIQWIPTDTVAEIMDAAGHALYPGKPDGVVLMARQCAREHFNTVYRFLLPFVTTPAKIAARAATMWQTFHDEGVASVEGFSEEGGAVLVVRGVPDLKRANRDFVAGWVIELIELAGGKSVNVTPVYSDPMVWKWRAQWS